MSNQQQQQQQQQQPNSLAKLPAQQHQQELQPIPKKDVSASAPKNEKGNSEKEEIESVDDGKVVSECEYYTEIGVSSMQISVTTIVLELIQNINLAFIGHLNVPEYVAAVGLADMLIYFSGGLFVIGLNEGFSSLASRSFGAKHYRLVGDYFNKALFLVIIAFIIISILALNGERILLFLRQPPEASRLASEYMIVFLPVIFFVLIYDLLRSYLNSLEIFTAHSTISLITTLLHPFMCMLFIPSGYKGIAYASCATHGINFISIILYIYITNPCPESLFFSYRSATKGLYKYLKTVVPIALPIFLDTCFYGVKTVIVGSFKNHIMLAAHVLVTNVFEILYCVFLGINVSLNTLSANAVGSRSIIKCKMLLKFAYFVGFVLSLIFIASLMFFDRQIYGLFTSNPEVLATMQEISKIIACFVAFDYVSSSVQGLLKGIGLGDKVFFGTIFGYWIVGFPVTILLGVYLNYQLQGVWIGYGLTAIVLFIINTGIIMSFKWEELIEEKYKEIEEEKALMEKEEEEFYEELNHSDSAEQQPQPPSTAAAAAQNHSV